MSTLDTHISIPKNIATADDLDFDFLRKKGLEHIEQLGSRLWTDYNLHDPGITILEMLCYAITDLGQRINMPIADILTGKDQEGLEKQFFKATEILPCKPVTAPDYRKLFIDIPGVKNCWMQTYSKKVYVDCKQQLLSYSKNDFAATPPEFKKDFLLKGLYTLLVDFEDFGDMDKAKQKAKKQTIKEIIFRKYHENRNLCEDLVKIEQVKSHPISVCAIIDVDPDADEEFVHAQVLRAIEKYFSPPLTFYSLREMLDKGYVSHEIFEGPLLENGFIDPEELRKTELRREVRLSDIINIIMDITGVREVKEISLNNCDAPDDGENWIICVDKDHKPRLCSKSTFSYTKGILPVNINLKKVEAYKKQLEAQESEDREKARLNRELKLPKGTYTETGAYTTIQNDFPDTYGIGINGLPSTAGASRKAWAKQLKGYLLFFDQVLAGYFKHLENVKELLSKDGELTRTYFSQAVKDIRDIDLIAGNGYDMNDNDKLTDTLFATLDDSVERRNKLLDHLIARFAERFGNYAFLMKALYGSASDEIVLANKQAFLKEYATVSRERGSAFNYYRQPDALLWNTDNVSGAQKRIARLAGIKNYFRRNLSRSFVQVYSLVNSGGDTVYRWRIRNESNHIVLSSTETYHTVKLAVEELYFAVRQIIETRKKYVETAFEKPVTEIVIDNVEVHKSASGKFSFHIINPEFESPSHPDRIIAKQFKYYNTQEEIRAAITDLIDFMKFTFTEEGMFLVEHVLLLPDVTKNTADAGFLPICTDDCEECHTIDPYSYRVSIVLPGYTLRFSEPNFREYLENLIRQELPAHILAKICWVGHRKGEVPDEENDLLQFEKTYKAFLEARTFLGTAQDKDTQEAFINALSQLNTIYPTGRLYDCDDEEEHLEGKLILGRTNIGTL
ncbi:hypothetical protein [Sinomicrobium sp. M5D2P9]